MSFDYRLCTEKDLPELRKLWEANTEWGTITDEMWQRYILDSPLGEMFMVLACDSETGEIVGEFAFTLTLLNVKGREIRAYRPGAPIVAKSARMFRSPNPLHHPVVAMYMEGVRILKERGDGLIYMVPDPRWNRFFKIFPALQCGKFPLWSLRLPLSQPFEIDPHYEVATGCDWDENVDCLWEQWSKFHGCAVVRNARILKWRVGYGDFLLTSIRRQGELVGLVAHRAKGDRQWLICDVLAADAGPALRNTLAAAANIAHRHAVEAPPEKPIRKVAILTTPVLTPVVQALGFERDAYDFPMVVHLLDPSVAREDVDPSRWYATAND